MKPYEHQQILIDEILNYPEKRNFTQLATGGGKTIVFSNLANNYKGRVLILVNRTELVEQTARNITRSISLITSKTKTVGAGKVLIGMVESVHNRIKKGVFNLDNIDLVIIDEAHNLQFTKVIENYNNRLIAFSATPVTLKSESYFKCKYCETKTETAVDCCGKETKKYTLKVSLKRWYGELIQGIEIDELIKLGYLTPVLNFSCDISNLDKLKVDSSGDFSKKSQDEVFNNVASTENLMANYKEHCLGKKTMVFNSNITANTEAYKMFKLAGYNVKSYDSKSKENRKQIVDWFKETPDGILMSVGVFTTGFDECAVEAIILNKATNSLSLYHQIVGRGGRITKKIFKPHFLCIDLGGNLGRFGSWSDPVDWKKIYDNEKEKKTQVRDLEDFIVCHKCDGLITEYDCNICGATAPPKREVKAKIVIAEQVKEMPPPTATVILNYAIAKGFTINEAKNLTANYIRDMFIYSNTSIDNIKANKDYLKNKIREFILPIYFMLQKSELKGTRNKTIKDFENKIQLKISKHYEAKK